MEHHNFTNRGNTILIILVIGLVCISIGTIIIITPKSTILYKESTWNDFPHICCNHTMVVYDKKDNVTEWINGPFFPLGYKFGNFSECVIGQFCYFHGNNTLVIKNPTLNIMKDLPKAKSKTICYQLFNFTNSTNWNVMVCK